MSKMVENAHRDQNSQAIAWRIRLRHGDCSAWEEFVTWLESDPGHSAAYDRVALADEDIPAEGVPALPAPAAQAPGPEDDVQRSRWMRRWASFAAGIAAVVLLGILFLPRLAPVPGEYEVVTGPGERKTVQLAEAGTALLNGSTRLVLDRNRPAYAKLAVGEATFDIRHNPRRQFMVAAGDQRVADIGTRFNLVRDRGIISLEVIEGGVRFNPSRQAIDLHAGQTLRVSETTEDVTIGNKPPSLMAGWRRGQLSYSAAPLETVVADLARTVGAEITLDSRISREPFTGSIHVGRDRDTAVKEFASVAGLASRRSADGWIIEPFSRAGR